MDVRGFTATASRFSALRLTLALLVLCSLASLNASAIQCARGLDSKYFSEPRYENLSQIHQTSHTIGVLAPTAAPCSS